jgi:hypothetical protein
MMEMQFGPNLARAVRVLRCVIKYHQAHRPQFSAPHGLAESNSIVMKESP